MADDDKDGIGDHLKDSKLAILLITAATASIIATIYHLLSACFGNPRRHRRPGPDIQDSSATPVSTDRILPSDLIPSHKYSGGGDGGDDDDDVCAVCLGEFKEGEELRALPGCSHGFHAPCIDAWLSSRVTCPVCRADATPWRSPVAVDEAGGHQLEVVVVGDQQSRRSTADN